MIIKLVTKSLIKDKMRFALAVFGVAAAVGLITWSIGLTKTTAHQSKEKVRRMTEPFNAWVTAAPVGIKKNRKARGPRMVTSDAQLNSTLPKEVVHAVETSDLVESFKAYKVINATLDYRPGGRVMQGPPLRAGITLAEASGCPYTEADIEGRWPDPESSTLEAAVCSAVFTPRRLDTPAIGSELVLLTSTGALKVKISAIIDFPECVNGFPTVFTTSGAMEVLYANNPIITQPDMLLCTVRNGKENKLDKVLESSLSSKFATSYHVVHRRQLENQHYSDRQRNFKRQAPLLLTLSALTALCMMMNALNIGVRQRLRMLALLRTAGMTRLQVSAVIVIEGALIALCGWILGCSAGWIILKVFVSRAQETFPSGACLGWEPVVMLAAAVAVTMLFSLLWPCRRVMRIRPLDALKEHRNEITEINPFKTAVGTVMLFPMLVLALPIPIEPITRSLLMLLVGIPMHITGILLILPAFIRLSEKLFVPAASVLLGIFPCLIRHRISANISHTTGMVLTLAVGLGTFTAIHIWGSSLTKPFLPSPELPDAIVSILPNGIPKGNAEKVSTLPGVAEKKCLPIEVLQLPTAAQKNTQRKKDRFGGPENVLLMGTDPTAAFGGDKPLAPFRFVEGSRKSAAKKLSEGRHCIITEMYARKSGLKTGDTLSLTQSIPRGKSRNISLIVEGIVDLNWHLVTSRAHLRGRNGMPGFTSGPVFVEESIVRKLSGNKDRTFFLWTNLSREYREMGALEGSSQLEAEIRKKLDIRTDNTVRVHHRDEIEDGTIAHASHLIGDMARAPFWSLIVLSTGIISLLIASYHATAHETAVMRAIGLTRNQLGRILFAEAMLVGLCGIILSVISGFFIGWTFTGWTRAWMPFSGLPVSLSIPWLTIFKGIGFAFALCAVMAVPPVLYLVRRNTIFAER
ncbi:MAG: ABC transporter permease [Kiritimatiellia bacterium]